MITNLKRPSSQHSPAEESANTRRTVEGIVDDIKKGGEAAVRVWSQELDHRNPASFQLSEQEIEHCLSSLPKQTLEDIRFAQQQIRHFAEAQRASIRDIEIETLPGVRLGHRNIPVQSVGCYVPGGRYPMVASAHMSIVTGRVAEEMLKEVGRQLGVLKTAAVAGKAWEDHGEVILVDSLEEMIAEANRIACEHVDVLTRNPRYFLERLTNYGSLFLGKETNVV